MTARVLVVKDLSAAPFSARIQAQMEAAFKPLVDSGHLTFDFAGTSKDRTYVLTFEAKYQWNSFERTSCQYLPFSLGVTGEVSLEAMRRANACSDVTKCSTCVPRYKNSPDELGKVIGNVAVHETGHLFGLQDAAAYKGADDAGHIGDPSNAMFSTLLHKDYALPHLDSARSKKYVVVEGDSLSGIARRIGWWPPKDGWRLLYDFKGKDGTVNKSLLRSGDPDLIFPGEEIWIPDFEERVKFLRSVQTHDQSFTKAQFDTMRTWLAAGRTLVY